MTTATLTFTRPTTRVDGSPLPASDIAAVNIYVDDPAAGGPELLGSITDPSQNSFVTPDLLVGLNEFTAKVLDTTGHLSEVSNVAAVTVPATVSAPSAIADLAATLNP